MEQPTLIGGERPEYPKVQLVGEQVAKETLANLSKHLTMGPIWDSLIQEDQKRAFYFLAKKAIFFLDLLDADLSFYKEGLLTKEDMTTRIATRAGDYGVSSLVVYTGQVFPLPFFIHTWRDMPAISQKRLYDETLNIFLTHAYEFTQLQQN